MCYYYYYCIKVWDFETIDNADISEDNTVFEMEPLTEIKVSLLVIHFIIGHVIMPQIGSDVSLKSLTRSADINNPHLWYAQDFNGAIWKIDIIVSHTVSIISNHSSNYYIHH